MRVLMTVEMDSEAASQSIRDGKLPEVMDTALKQLQPEAAYFATHDGNRTAYIVFDLREPAQMPQVAEPFFSALKAKINMCPVMNADDVREGISRLSRA
ncbi:MAG TPA: hypothetical protein VF054_14445 [Micromonosporaceae bacterium]